jgi:beta-1,4-mannosyl-glycoprotein beta-1,4-N-acetylglucosaminyltransferase
MNIYDCFMYFDEDLLLDLRLNVLNKYVKKFVITEALYTHNGTKKKLRFDINNFRKFKDKIHYIIVDDQPPNILDAKENDTVSQKGEKLILNGYARDNYQRNRLADGLKEALDDDLVMISDLDEIPNLKNLNFEKINNKIILFNQKMFYYKLNLLYKDFNWFGTRASKKKNLISPQWLRNIKSKKYSRFRLDLFFSQKKYSDIFFVNDGGWHFTCIRTPEDLEYKLLNFAHHYEFEESGLKINDIKKLIAEKRVMYDHTVDQRGYKWSGKSKLIRVESEAMPNYISTNLSKYKDWLD